MKIFYAIPPPLFSAAAELRSSTLNLNHFTVVPLKVLISNPLSKSSSIHPRRLTSPDSLEVRFVKAKFSIVVSTIPNSLINYENTDAYYPESKTEYYPSRIYICGVPIPVKKN